ncbi:MAG TPA: DUF6232 family protein [Myxococcaceae bacterium]|nr:DUF6232 family protein [Myxococcaceae bacterium]
MVITNARFVVNGHLYATANITSAKLVKGSKVGSIVLGVLGLFMLLGNAAALGVVFLVMAGIWFALVKSFLVLATSGGEVRALALRDVQFLTRALAALNEAIIARG